jgi:hypothetical protein
MPRTAVHGLCVLASPLRVLDPLLVLDSDRRLIGPAQPERDYCSFRTGPSHLPYLVTAEYAEAITHLPFSYSQIMTRTGFPLRSVTIMSSAQSRLLAPWHETTDTFEYMPTRRATQQIAFAKRLSGPLITPSYCRLRGGRLLRRETMHPDKARLLSTANHQHSIATVCIICMSLHHAPVASSGKQVR